MNKSICKAFAVASLLLSGSTSSASTDVYLSCQLEGKSPVIYRLGEDQNGKKWGTWSASEGVWYFKLCDQDKSEIGYIRVWSCDINPLNFVHEFKVMDGNGRGVRDRIIIDRRSGEYAEEKIVMRPPEPELKNVSRGMCEPTTEPALPDTKF